MIFRLVDWNNFTHFSAVGKIPFWKLNLVCLQMGIANSSDPSFKRDVDKLSTLGALKMLNDFIIPINVESWIWVSLKYLFVGVNPVQ